MRLVLRNQNGQPVTGYAVLFELDGDGRSRRRHAPAPGSTYVGPVQTGEVMATDNNGVARVVYTAGTDLRDGHDLRATVRLRCVSETSTGASPSCSGDTLARASARREAGPAQGAGPEAF